MSNLTCGNRQCRKVFGPMVGAIVMVEAGGQLYCLDSIRAITCECCQHTLGSVPPVASETTVEKQDIRCPACDRKSGEFIGEYAHIQAGKRSVWAYEIVKIQCRCGCHWNPEEIKRRASVLTGRESSIVGNPATENAFRTAVAQSHRRAA